MVNAKLVQHRGMQVMDRDAFLHGFEADVVGGSNGLARFDAGSGAWRARR